MGCDVAVTKILHKFVLIMALVGPKVMRSAPPRSSMGCTAASTSAVPSAEVICLLSSDQAMPVIHDHMPQISQPRSISQCLLVEAAIGA